ncbi:hypothetical protein K443DRAFT_16022 [Laccaria amethystina LaAM-08-1]|uniref:Unplaced genomic scaffold K443scaffold_1106, whole genome shotgun sequence n=1 Tax=Laccaria amethystina LaAM-08-1 TaxID=1095629 RepID=A0A0C9WKL0_9AGAR|nr:hypothetical protein K443DRAFT_16022 [Laccaria amethystina LaAM-08-1]
MTSTGRTDNVRYSLDLDKSWLKHDVGIKFRPRALMTLPYSSSQRFLLRGQVARKDQTKDIGCVVINQLDFSGTRKQYLLDQPWYKRRKPDADCHVGEKYSLVTTTSSETEKIAFPSGRSRFLLGYVLDINPDQTYKGSWGWRKIWEFLR